MAAKKRKLPKNKPLKPRETLAKAESLECRRRTTSTRAELFLLASIMFLIVIFLAFSKYMITTDLGVNVISRNSSCFSDQKIGSSAEWSNGNILMETAFEVPDPCYRVSFIDAVEQGNRIEIKIGVESGGMCMQCFGYSRIEYEIVSPEKENSMDIYVDVEGATKHYVWLPLSV
jgi:hypothetical protein